LMYVSGNIVAMGDLFIGLCSYLALHGNGDNACHTAASQAYNQSIFKPYYEEQEKAAGKYGLGIYNTLPMNKPLGAIALIGYDAYKKDFKIPLTNNINLEYNNSYTCNLKWEF
jgi:hypothetical protein